jgi:hypothetical protein
MLVTNRRTVVNGLAVYTIIRDQLTVFHLPVTCHSLSHAANGFDFTGAVELYFKVQPALMDEVALLKSYTF